MTDDCSRPVKLAFLHGGSGEMKNMGDERAMLRIINSKGREGVIGVLTTMHFGARSAPYGKEIRWNSRLRYRFA